MWKLSSTRISNKILIQIYEEKNAILEYPINDDDTSPEHKNYNFLLLRTLCILTRKLEFFLKQIAFRILSKILTWICERFINIADKNEEFRILQSDQQNRKLPFANTLIDREPEAEARSCTMRLSAFLFGGNQLRCIVSCGIPSIGASMQMPRLLSRSAAIGGTSYPRLFISCKS